MKNLLFVILILFSFFIQSQNDISQYEEIYAIDTVLHKVKRKETLYSISKIYSVSVKDLKKFNPNVQGNKLSRKMLLVVPVKRLLERKKIFVDNKKIKSTPLYAVENIKKINFLKSLFTSINYLIWGDV